jgi:hypothetical protein
MIVIVPKKVYKDNDPFPMIALPTSDTGDDKVWSEFTLDDFQWWAKTSDFDAWFKTSGRSWKADESEDLSKYSGVIDENNSVLSFDDFVKANSHLLDESEYTILEDEGEGGGEGGESGKSVPRYEISEKQIIKFMFAYQQLLADGKIDLEYDMAGFPIGDDKCIFLSNGADNENPEVESISTTGFRFVAKSNVGSGVVLEYDKAYPGPVDIKGDDPVLVAERKFSTIEGILNSETSKFVVTGVVFAAVIGFVGSKAWWLYKQATSVINVFQDAKKTAKFVTKTGKVTKNAKTAKKLGIFKGISKLSSRFYNNFVKYPAKFYKGGSAAVKALKTGRKLKSFRKLTAIGKVGKTISTFIKGGAKVASKGMGIGKVTNPIGWVLLGVDAVGSLLNWMSDNQAPTYNEAKDLFGANKEFSPSGIKVGETITLCWAQESTSAWGVALSFVVSNMGETRTVLSMTKILDDLGGNSVFLLQSANSESLNKQIQSNLITVIAVPNSTKLEHGIFDNDDFDGIIASVPHDNGAEPSPWFFKGICEWTDLESAVEKADDAFFRVDPKAPETYAWNFRDVDGDLVNVTGKLVSDEDLEKFSAKELMDLFHGGRVVNPENTDIGKGSQDSSGGKKIQTLDASPGEKSDQGSEKEAGKEDEKDSDAGEETDAEVRESYFSRVVESFSEYDPEMDDINEDIEGLDVDPNKLSKPVYIAIYICKADGRKQYASKSVADRKSPPLFTNFVIDPDDYNAKKGEPIEVVTNTDEIITKPKRGLMIVKEDDVDIEDEGGSRKTGGREREKEEETDLDSGEETDKEVRSSEDMIDATGMVKRETDRSTVIRDKEKSGPSLIEEFLDQKSVDILDIKEWKRITYIKEKKSRSGETFEIILKNSDARFSDRTRIYDKDSGLPFEIAKKFVKTCVDRLKFPTD